MPGSQESSEATKALTFAEFLSEAPLLVSRAVQVSITSEASPSLMLPAIALHCSNPSCAGTRFFDPDSEKISLHRYENPIWVDYLIDFYCRNCRRTQKSFALRLRGLRLGEILNATPKTLDMRKFGEIPPFGEPRPNVIKDVLDDDIKFFERGYRAETAGLGIGAFAYYRRFVESHKDRIIAEIRQVAVAQGAKQDVLATLDRAATMISFENAVKEVKDAIPDSLRHTGGHNPLTLLHSALSAGLHSEDDEQCLELAKDIRLLLTDLAERTSQTLKNNGELSQAVTRLLKKATEKAARQNKDSSR